MAADTVAKTEQVLSAHVLAATQLQLKLQPSIASEGAFEFFWRDPIAQQAFRISIAIYLYTYIASSTVSSTEKSDFISRINPEWVHTPKMCSSAPWVTRLKLVRIA